MNRTSAPQTPGYFEQHLLAIVGSMYAPRAIVEGGDLSVEVPAADAPLAVFDRLIEENERLGREQIAEQISAVLRDASDVLVAEMERRISRL